MAMTGEKFQKLLEAEQRAAADMRRAFHRWEKAHRRVKRGERALDNNFTRRASDIPGKADWTDLGSSDDGNKRLSRV